MNNTRTLKIVIVLLILLNLGTLAFIWFTSPLSRRNEQGAFASAYLVKELGLSASQQNDYSLLRRNHHQMLGKLQDRDKALHTLFFKQLFSEVPDPEKTGALADSIAENRRKMEILTFDHFLKVRQMLTPGQQKKFGDIFEDVIRMVMPPPPPPPSLVLPPGPPVPPPPPVRK